MGWILLNQGIAIASTLFTKVLPHIDVPCVAHLCFPKRPHLLLYGVYVSSLSTKRLSV